MKKNKIFVVGNSIDYVNWIENCELTNNVEKANIVFFTGGEDVSPDLYNCKKHVTTYCNAIRDLREVGYYNYVQTLKNKPLCIGVCRGSQLICALNGGKLIQNCNNHAIWNTHNITFNDGEQYEITSTHHQMAYPFNLPEENYELIAWSTEKRSEIYEGDKIDKKLIIKEPEIIYYPKTKMLGIQGHPEMMNKCELHNKLNSLIQKYI